MDQNPKSTAGAIIAYQPDYFDELLERIRDIRARTMQDIYPSL